MSAIRAELRNAFVATSVVALAGELDLYGADALRDELDDALSSGAGRVVVDLTSVTFIDSTALGILLRAQQRVVRRGGRFAAVTGDLGMQKIFEITGLDGTLPAFTSLHEALAWVGISDVREDLE